MATSDNAAYFMPSKEISRHAYHKVNVKMPTIDTYNNVDVKMYVKMKINFVMVLVVIFIN